MKIKTIEYPTSLEKITDPFNDNIDVFVETEDGYHFTMTVSTPQFYLTYMEKENRDFIEAAPPDIIVKELKHEIIMHALESYCEDDGYWMKLYYLAGTQEGCFSKENLDALVQLSKSEIE